MDVCDEMDPVPHVSEKAYCSPFHAEEYFSVATIYGPWLVSPTFEHLEGLVDPQVMCGGSHKLRPLPF